VGTGSGLGGGEVAGGELAGGELAGGAVTGTGISPGIFAEALIAGLGGAGRCLGAAVARGAGDAEAVPAPGTVMTAGAWRLRR